MASGLNRFFYSLPKDMAFLALPPSCRDSPDLVSVTAWRVLNGFSIALFVELGTQDEAQSLRMQVAELQHVDGINRELRDALDEHQALVSEDSRLVARQHSLVRVRHHAVLNCV